MISVGFRGTWRTWETVQTVRKHYVILMPGPDGPADNS